MVLLLSIFYNPGDASYSIAEIVELATMQDVVRQFIIALPTYIKEVSVIIFPFSWFLRYFSCLRDSTGADRSCACWWDYYTL